MLSCWGATPAEFPLLDQPPAAAFAQATAALAAIGAADPQVAARLAQLPVDPRLGKALLDFGPAAAPTVALLSLGETGNIALRRPDQREVRRFQRLAGPSTSRRAAPGEVIGHAFPHLVARRVADGEYLLAQGTRAAVPAEFGLMGEEWLAVADVRLERSGRARIQAAAPIAESAALDVIGVSEKTECVFEDGRVRATRVVTAGAIVLSRTPVRPAPGVARAAVAAVVRERGVGLFPMSGRAARLWDRLRFWRIGWVIRGRMWRRCRRMSGWPRRLIWLLRAQRLRILTCIRLCSGCCRGRRRAGWMSWRRPSWWCRRVVVFWLIMVGIGRGCG